jgi:SAM-dependent methyltransferase
MRLAYDMFLAWIDHQKVLETVSKRASPMCKGPYEPERYLATSPLESSDTLARLARDKQLAKARFVQEWLSRHFTSPPTIADISCGSAFLSQILDYNQYIGVDHPRLLQSQAPASSRVTLVPYDFETAEDGLDIGTLADLVVSFETIEHLTGPENFLVQIRNNLRPGGNVILSTPNNPYGAPVRYPDHVREYSVHEILDLLGRTGFKTDKIYALGVPFGLLTALLRKRKVRVYRSSLNCERGFLSKASDSLSFVRKLYCRIIPYKIAGIPVGDTGENILLIASKEPET